jgi:hypothetical protein
MFFGERYIDKNHSKNDSKNTSYSSFGTIHTLLDVTWMLLEKFSVIHTNSL